MSGTPKDICNDWHLLQLRLGSVVRILVSIELFKASVIILQSSDVAYGIRHDHHWTTFKLKFAKSILQNFDWMIHGWVKAS